MDREQAIKAIVRDFPDVPKQWCEMAYDFCVKHPEESEKLKEKLEQGQLPAKVREPAGELLSVDIL
jgi:hypothetical protein